MTLPRSPGSLTRRQFLKLGGLTLTVCGGLGVTPYRLSASGSSSPGDDPAVIFIWLPGGPPHMETYDLKPDAPAEFRGEFRPIRTNVPGLDVCEHLPLHAQFADKYVLIRSVAHRFADHGGGHKKFLTGRDPRQPDGFINDTPMVGSMAYRVLGQRPGALPGYICGVDGGRQHIDTFSFGSAYLDSSTHPFFVVGDPAEPNFQIRNLDLVQPRGRMEDRLNLLARLDRVPDTHDTTGTMASIQNNRQRALDVLNTDNARHAFDLAREPSRVRERYGLHRYGQRCLMARRLVEAGASFVTMVLENPTFPGQPMPNNVTYNWDSHAVNCHLYEDSRFRFPMYDRAITALIEDLYDRGLDRKVLLIVTGEFGRTPRITYDNGRPGRDHWPQAMSMLVAGGGIRTGQVIGSTNSRGEEPRNRPLTPNDLWATMFRHLDIDPHRTSFLDHTGRPMPLLPEGEVIRELF